MAEVNRLPLRVAVGVGLVVGSTLALQVLLTRLFSAVLFYHFAFLAISLGLLGVGAGAILLYMRPSWFERGGAEAGLALWGTVLAVLLLAAPLVLVELNYPADLAIDADFILIVGIAALVSALPFLVAGIVIAIAVKRYVRSIGRLYFFDLLGAAAGAVAVVPLMRITDPPTLIVSLGALAAVAVVLFAGPAARWRLVGAGLAICGAALTAAAATSSAYDLPPRLQLLGPVAPSVVDRWSPLTRVVGYPPAPETLGTDTAAGAVTYDLDVAPVPVYDPEAGYRDWKDLDLGPQSIGYELTGPGSALVIGGGGGRDIHNALSSGQTEVDVIELNDVIRDVVDDDLGQYSGAPYEFGGVDTEIGDGRSTLAASDETYDTIHIGFTNTLSANAASSFALTENNLYTVEAFEEYIDHLNPGGVLNISRLRFFSGEEALRATVLTLEALRRHGVERPERNVVTLMSEGAGGEFGTTLARLEPFTTQELRRIERLAAQRDSRVVFAPGGPFEAEWALLAAAPSPAEFCASHRVDVCPPTDDKPFFFNMVRLGDLGQSTQADTYARTPYIVLLVTLGILVALSALAFGAPLALVRGRGRPPLGSLSFFALIGLGFLILEIVLIQRFVLFLGYPTYALSVVISSLLLFTGLGSALAGRWRDPRRALTIALSAAIALIGLSALGLQDLLRELIDLPFAARIAVTMGLLAPLGLALGTAMPIGLVRLAALYPSGVPWAWGINGVMSVLASVFAIAVAITWGFTVVTLLALACYAGALAHALLGGWPGRASGAADRDEVESLVEA